MSNGLDVVWLPGAPPKGMFDVTLDSRADAWLFSELADVVDPKPWMVDVQAARLDMTPRVQSALRDPNGEVEVAFDVAYNRQTPALRVLQTVPSQAIVKLTQVIVQEA